MKKKLSLGGLVVGGLITLVTIGNTKIISENVVNNISYIDTTTKYKNISDVSVEELNVNWDEISILSKTEDVTIFEEEINEQNINYYVLNNKSGIYWKQDEMSNLNKQLLQVGYDDSNQNSKKIHYRVQGSEFIDYYYETNHDSFEEGENYRFDDAVSVDTFYDPSAGKTKRGLEITHSKLTDLNFKITITNDWWDIGDDPKIEDVKYEGYDDGLYAVQVKVGDNYDWYYIDVDSKHYSKNDEKVPEPENLISVQNNGRFLIYPDGYRKKQSGANSPSWEHYEYSSASWINYEHPGSFLTPIDNNAMYKNVNGDSYWMNFDNFEELNKTKYPYDINFDDYSQWSQLDNGNYWILNNGDVEIVSSLDGSTKKLNPQYVNLNNLISINETNVVALDTNNNFVNSYYLIYGIEVLNREDVNVFFDNPVIPNKIYFDYPPEIFIHSNSNIKYVWIDDDYVLPTEEDLQAWEFDFNDYIDESKSINTFTLKWELNNGETDEIEVEIMNNYLPQIEVSSDYLGDLDRSVYYDNEVEQYDGLIDGYYSQYQKYLKIDENEFYYIDSIFVNDIFLNDKNLSLVKEGNYELNNLKSYDDIRIIDKFGKEWNYRIYNDLEPQKYWSENEIGQETSKKAEALDKDYKNDNALESYNLSIELLDTFDLSYLNGDKNFVDYKADFLQDDLFNNSGYNSRIPINQYTPDESIPGLTDSKGNHGLDSTGLSFREWYEHWTIDAINYLYSSEGINLEYGDIEFVFEENNGNDLMNLDNQLGHFEATEQGIDNERVIGLSNSYEDSIDLFEYIEISTIKDSNYLEELEINLNNEFGVKEFEYDATFNEVENDLNEVIYQTLIDYYPKLWTNNYGFDWSKVSEETYSIEHLNFKYFDQDGNVIERNTLLRDIETIDIKVEADEDNGGIFINSNDIDGSQIIYDYSFDFIHIEGIKPINPESSESTWIWFIIMVLVILLFLLILFMVWFLQNRRRNKVFRIDNEKVNEKDLISKNKGEK